MLVIAGSARSDGHTAMLVDAVLGGKASTRLDLYDLHITPYEYGQPFDRDDFARVALEMIGHEVIVFATPVYWYAMSGRMKTLFDRFTDLVTVRKDLGRQLSGRSAFLLACGSDVELPAGFEEPFRETAAYLGMRYGGAFYGRTTKSGLLPESISSAAAFGERLFTEFAESP